MGDERVSGLTNVLLKDMTAFMDFFLEYESFEASPDDCDFVAGNPHEFALPEFVEALQRWSVPQDKDWFAYKMNEREAQEPAAEALRERTGVAFEPDDIAMTTGAFGGLTISMRAVVDPGDEVIFLTPPWFFYEAIVHSIGATPVRVPLEPPSFDLNVEGLAAAITDRTRAVIVNTPQTPTGRIYPTEQFEALAEVLREASARNGRPIYWISDEAYCYITYDGKTTPSPAAIYDDTLLVYTYGKTLLTPGQRIGYVALPPTMTDREQMRIALLAMQLVTAYAIPTALLQHALRDIEWPMSIDLKNLQSKRDRMVDALTSYGYDIYSPEATFYLLPVSPDPDDLAFSRKLAEDKVFVLPGTVCEIPGYFRISLTASDAMIDRALPIFERAIG